MPLLSTRTSTPSTTVLRMMSSKMPQSAEPCKPSPTMSLNPSPLTVSLLHPLPSKLRLLSLLMSLSRHLRLKLRLLPLPLLPPLLPHLRSITRPLVRLHPRRPPLLRKPLLPRRPRNGMLLIHLTFGILCDVVLLIDMCSPSFPSILHYHSCFFPASLAVDSFSSLPYQRLSRRLMKQLTKEAKQQAQETRRCRRCRHPCSPQQHQTSSVQETSRASSLNTFSTLTGSASPSSAAQS